MITQNVKWCPTCLTIEKQTLYYFVNQTHDTDNS